MLNIDQDELIEQLDLIPHEEGGYYSQTYKSQDEVKTEREHNNGVRCFSTCIYYMLTEGSPIGSFHKNLSPNLHFYHGGSPITYRFIYPDGRAEEQILGPDVKNGHKLQLIVPADVWKSTEIGKDYPFGLVSEVVQPGWDENDCILAEYDTLVALYPEHSEWIKQYSYDREK
ncbi:cupin domain-containing protein [Vibrio profundum]|uniref:cupin domain-containing protein n=1 Tax=Vibrio profundum TaxID=2910247 RepID=UPI003D148835